MAEERVQKLLGHLAANPAQCPMLAANETNATPQVMSAGMFNPPTDAQIIEHMKNMETLRMSLEDRTQRTKLNEIVPGPLDDMSEFDMRTELQRAFLYGQNMLLMEKWVKKHGKNIVIPWTMTPRSAMPYQDWLVTIGDAEDATRILMNHPKKSEIYGIAFLGDGVLSTRDNDLWMEQRKHLQEAFLPNQALKQYVFPESLKRAQFASRKRLREMIGPKPSLVVEMNEFLLHEAMAQLQLALIGEKPEDMEKLNVPLRRAHENSLKVAIEPFEQALERRKTARKIILDYSEQVLSHCPQGVLGQRLVDNCPFGKDDPKIKRDTVSTFNFAGYDTTGNLMTWAMYEMSRNTKIQDKVRKEIDALYAELARDNREMNYDDMQKLPYLSRVITETLRLWPSVPNGTFRELERDDVIKGKNGKMVTLPKGTQLNIPVWLLHTSEELWGPTVEEFNPDRDFLPQEVWNGAALAAWNPQSHRYMPFTSAPRDCIGKNFAHMEARLILTELLRNYEFKLAEPTLSASARGRERNEHFLAFNAGTMSPKNGIHLEVRPRNL